MRIEEVEALADKFLDEEIFQDRYYAAEFLWSGFEQTIKALQAEAWYPIERAEEMGVKDGQEVLAWCKDGDKYLVTWGMGRWQDENFRPIAGITHFKIISPPEVN